VGAHGDVLGGLGRDLFGEDLVEEVGVGELLGRGLLEKGLEALVAFEEPQALEVGLEPLELAGAHGATSARAS